MTALLDKAIAGFVTLIRKDGYLDQCVWKFLASMPRRGDSERTKEKSK